MIIISKTAGSRATEFIIAPTQCGRTQKYKVTCHVAAVQRCALSSLLSQQVWSHNELEIPKKKQINIKLKEYNDTHFNCTEALALYYAFQRIKIKHVKMGLISLGKY